MQVHVTRRTERSVNLLERSKQRSYSTELGWRESHVTATAWGSELAPEWCKDWSNRERQDRWKSDRSPSARITGPVDEALVERLFRLNIATCVSEKNGK